MGYVVLLYKYNAHCAVYIANETLGERALRNPLGVVRAELTWHLRTMKRMEGGGHEDLSALEGGPGDGASHIRRPHKQSSHRVMKPCTPSACRAPCARIPWRSVLTTDASYLSHSEVERLVLGESAR